MMLFFLTELVRVRYSGVTRSTQNNYFPRLIIEAESAPSRTMTRTLIVYLQLECSILAIWGSQSWYR
jgi:hypothetical protein